MLLKKKSLTLSLTTMVKSFLFHFQLSNIFENILFLKCSYSDKCKKRCIFSLKHFHFPRHPLLAFARKEQLTSLASQEVHGPASAQTLISCN